MSEQTTANSLADLKNLVQGTPAAIPGTEGAEKNASPSATRRAAPMPPAPARRAWRACG